jgi:soluble lytic murein transglycosylase-like protein
MRKTDDYKYSFHVMWSIDYTKNRRKVALGWGLTVLVVFILVLRLWFVSYEEKTIVNRLSFKESLLLDYKAKEEIYKILRVNGFSLGQGIDIADIVIKQTKSLSLPLPLVMAVMKVESDMYVNAKSKSGALGLMQIMPATWDVYIKKLGLSVARQAAFDPIMNVKVGTHILKDLFDFYKNFKEEERLSRTLSAYNAGPDNGIQPAYVSAVNKQKAVFAKRLRDE